MDELSRDPVFGALARALAPRAHVTLAGTPALVPDVGWLEVSFHLAELPVEDRRALESARALARPGAPGAAGRRALAHAESAAPASFDVGRERAVVACPRFVLADLARASAACRALLAAHDAASTTPPAPRVMGIVNVTPDSFSDGGRHFDAARAVAHGLILVEQGAAYLDVGGESTRPGAPPVDEREELRRVVPVVSELARRTSVVISVDTTKSAVAAAALDAGATLVNDVSGGRFDPAMLPLVARHGAGFVAMHMRGTPRDMQDDPHYDDVVCEVVEHLRERAAAALAAGVARERLWIDPGIGFGKTTAHNVALLRQLPEARSLGLGIVLGVSRKSFLARLHPPAAEDRERVGGTAAACTFGVLGGAGILRVHDVAVMAQAVAIAQALRPPTPRA